MSDYGLFENNTRAIACAVVVVMIMAMIIGAISYYNHTEAERSIACSNAGGTYRDGGCDL